jgi:hypothetical protein
VVWSSTVVRVPLPGYDPPYRLAYVDLCDGPRILARVAVGTAGGSGDAGVVPAGTRVRLVGSQAGNLVVEITR